MQATTLYDRGGLSIYRYRCTAGPGDRPFSEMHARHSLSYVASGSFGCRTLGGAHELVAGAVMVGKPGRESTATHEHHGCGDECLSVKFSPEHAESVPDAVWDLAVLPPLPELMILGELVFSGASVEEAAL